MVPVCKQASFTISKSGNFKDIDHLRILRLIVRSVYLGWRGILNCPARQCANSGQVAVRSENSNTNSSDPT